MPRTLALPACLLAVAVLVGGCEEEPDEVVPSTVDVVWIVDNSNSMHQDQQALADHAGTLFDHVDGAGFDVDYRMGVTTTQSRPCAHDETTFDDCEDCRGNTGRLRGLGNVGQDTSQPPTVLVPGAADNAADFAAMVDMDIYGATEEYGLWVLVQAICASLHLPYDTDFLDWATDTPYECSGANWNAADPLASMCHCLPPVAEDYNIDADGQRFLRGQGTLMAVIVSDEGDYTPNMGTVEWPWDLSGCDLSRPYSPWPSDIVTNCGGSPANLCTNYCKLDVFLQFFEALDQQVIISVLGPGATLIPDGPYAGQVELYCGDQASQVTMAEFYLWAAYLTDGIYRPLTVEEGGCIDQAEWEDIIGDLGTMIANLGG